MTPPMSNPRSLSSAGLAAIVGGAVAIALTPPFAIAYYNAYPGFDALPPWISALRPNLTALLTFDRPLDVYNLYGRVYDVVYALFLPAAFAAHALHRNRRARLEKWGFVILVLGLLACFVGVAGDYWADGAGFPLEFAGLLILAAGATLYGVALLRSKVLPGWCAWPLVACGPGAFVSFALVGHVPSGPTLPIACYWLMLGGVLCFGQGARQAVSRTTRAAPSPQPAETTTLDPKQP